MRAGAEHSAMFFSYRRLQPSYHTFFAAIFVLVLALVLVLVVFLVIVLILVLVVVVVVVFVARTTFCGNLREKRRAPE